MKNIFIILCIWIILFWGIYFSMQNKSQTIWEEDTVISQEVSEEQYIDYSQNELNNSKEEFLILFFHAAWCPSCKAFEEKILSEEIPENIKFLKVDYDSQAELRKKYNVVSQTTFVLVNSDGELKKRWIGSRDLQDILTQLEDIPESIKTYSDEELRAKLTPLQYKVTQQWGTEPAFDNKYWDFKWEWIYVDIIDGTALFSSTDKYQSGTGWPAFTKPIDDNFISSHDDNSLWMQRTEIKSQKSHLWHVFEDGPESEGGLRYCINSAALDFVPKEELEKRWYSKYLFLFEE